MEVKKNEGKRRFEVEVEGLTGVLEYRLEKDSIVFTHTGVPTQIAGRGIASMLTKAGLQYAQAQQLKVVPLCPFVQRYLTRHSEYQNFKE